MGNKFVCFCSVKICASGLVKLLESIFCLLLVVEALSLQKVFKMLEKVIVGWREVRWISQIRQNFIAQFVQFLWLCMCYQALSWRRIRPFLLTNASCKHCSFWCISSMLSILLRCNGFAGIQRAVVDQADSRPPNSDHDLFLLQIWHWEVLWSYFLVQPY